MLVPSAVIEPGLAETVDVAVEAEPPVTEKVELSFVIPVFDAVTVTDPAVWPVTVSEATPLDAVAVPRPLTEPAPAV